MAKEEKTKTAAYVLWILMAIIGVGLLFTGLQNSVLGDSIVTSVMFIVVGIILLFIGLMMILGRANIETSDIEMPSKKKENKNNKK